MINLSPRQQVSTTLINLLTDLTEAPPDTLFGVDLAPDNTLSGYFSQEQELFEFHVTPGGEFSYVESNDRASHAYLSGLKIQDARELRNDRKPRCVNSKPCGEGCIPRGHRCTQGLSNPQKQAAQAVQETVQAQKKQGNWKGGALIGGAVALGLLGVAAVGVGAAIAASGSTSSFGRTAPPPTPAPPTLLNPAPDLFELPARGRFELPARGRPQPTQPPTQAVLVSDPTTGIPQRSPRPMPAPAPTFIKGTQLQGQQDPIAALMPAPDLFELPARGRLQNETQPVSNSTVITSPNQMVLVSDPRSGEPSKKAPRPLRTQQSIETSASNPKAKESSPKPRKQPDPKPEKSPISANSKKKPPAKPEIEQQTDRLLKQHQKYATSAQQIAASKANPEAIAQAQKDLARLEVRHRQMMNPLQENYFDSAAKEVRSLSKQLSQADRAALTLQTRLLKGKTVERHQQETQAAIGELDDHLNRLQYAQAALGSVKNSKNRDRVLEGIEQQRSTIETLRNQVRSVQQAVAQNPQPVLSDLQQRLSALPTRIGQLDEQSQAQHRQIQRIRKLQGEMPTRVADFARQHSSELDELDKQTAAISQTSADHDRDRDFATQSIQGLIERRKTFIDQDMQLLRLISGKDGIKWVTSKDVGDMPNGLAIVLRRAQEETGVREIRTVEEAAKFRQHVMGHLSKRVEGYLKDIEKRADYPQAVSDRAVEAASAQLTDLHELQKQAVIEGRRVSQGLVRDLEKTAKQAAVQLAGSTVQQPYRQAHEFLVQDIQNAHAQKARAVAEAIVTAEQMRDRLTRIAQTPTVFEMEGTTRSTTQLAQEVADVRTELKQVKTVTTVKLGNVRPTEETVRSMATRAQRLAQNDVVRSQIDDLRGQLGVVTQQIAKRAEAADRGQKKGTATGRLEAQKAALQKRIETLAQQFTGIEKRDSRSAFTSGIVKSAVKQLRGAG